MRLLHRILMPTYFLVLIALLSTNVLSAKCVYSKPIKIKKIDVGNMISWSTLEEVDNKFFVIEKSTDGIKFKKVGDVKGAGNSNSVQTYRFLDFSLGERKVFYRLKHFTSDGSYTYSETFLHERSTQNNLMITSMSSTETDRKLSLTIKSAVDTNISFEFKARNGTVISRGNKKVTKGLNALSFDCSELPRGRYEVTIRGNKEIEKIYIRKVNTSEAPKVDYEVRQK